MHLVSAGYVFIAVCNRRVLVSVWRSALYAHVWVVDLLRRRSWSAEVGWQRRQHWPRQLCGQWRMGRSRYDSYTWLVKRKKKFSFSNKIFCINKCFLLLSCGLSFRPHYGCCPSVRSYTPMLVFLRLFVFELGARTRTTDRQTNGPVMWPIESISRSINQSIKTFTFCIFSHVSRRNRLRIICEDFYSAVLYRYNQLFVCNTTINSINFDLILRWIV